MPAIPACSETAFRHPFARAGEDVYHVWVGDRSAWAVGSSLKPPVARRTCLAAPCPGEPVKWEADS